MPAPWQLHQKSQQPYASTRHAAEAKPPAECAVDPQPHEKQPCVNGNGIVYEFRKTVRSSTQSQLPSFNNLLAQLREAHERELAEQAAAFLGNQRSSLGTTQAPSSSHLHSFSEADAAEALCGNGRTVVATNSKTSRPRMVHRDSQESGTPPKSRRSSCGESSSGIEVVAIHPSVCSHVQSHYVVDDDTYKLLPMWQDFEVDRGMACQYMRMKSNTSSSFQKQGRVSDKGRGRLGLIPFGTATDSVQPGWLQRRLARIISPPDAPWRVCWDIVGAILIGWDIVFIPLQVFDLPEDIFLMIVQWLITIFWTMDICFSFFVGFYKKGSLHMDQSSIVKHYLTTWFPIDAIVVTADWLSVLDAMQSNLDYSKFGRLARIIRTVRVIRLLRLFKLKKILEDLQEHIYTEYAFIVATVVKLLMFIIVTNHFVACLWYLVGTLSQEKFNDSWVDEFLTNSEGVTCGAGYSYTTALHWSLTQFMPASMEVNPRTWLERTFAILVLIAGMITFSSFVSNITQSMTSLRNIRTEDTKQLWLLRRFLQQRKVPKNLGMRLTSYLEYTCEVRQSRIQESDIRLLQMLSDPLRNELQFELKIKNLSGHPLFNHLRVELQVLMHRFCQKALKIFMLAAGDVLFYRGDEAANMYFFISGDVDYFQLDGTLLQPTVQKNEAIAEATIWTKWRHVGDLRAGASGLASGSELLSIDADQFGKVMGRNPNAWVVTSLYARKFLHALNAMGPEGSSDVFRPDNFYETVMEDCEKELKAHKEGEEIKNTGYLAQVFQLIGDGLRLVTTPSNLSKGDNGKGDNAKTDKEEPSGNSGDLSAL